MVGNLPRGCVGLYVGAPPYTCHLLHHLHSTGSIKRYMHSPSSDLHSRPSHNDIKHPGKDPCSVTGEQGLDIAQRSTIAIATLYKMSSAMVMSIFGDVNHVSLVL